MKIGRTQEMRGQRPRGDFHRRDRRVRREFDFKFKNRDLVISAFSADSAVISHFPYVKNRTAHTRMGAVLYGGTAPTRLCAPTASGLARGVGRGLER